MSGSKLYHHGSRTRNMKMGGMYDSREAAVRAAKPGPTRDAWIFPRESFWFMRYQRGGEGKVYVERGGYYEETKP